MFLRPYFPSPAVFGAPASPPAPDITTGLLIYWPFDTADNNFVANTTADHSGSGRTGTLVGMTSDHEVAGKIAQGLSFDGTTSWIESPDISLSITELTIAAWIKTNSTALQVIGLSGASLLRMDPGNSKIAWYADSNISSVEVTATINADTWYHIAVTQDVAKNWVVYQNGISLGSDVDANSVSTIFFKVFAGVYSTLWKFSGVMDEFRIYSRALSQDDMTALVAFTG